ncbi:MAG: hypothetical protein QOI91_2441 [Solirubrobacteraceae bacterium]|jgi:hypothetical protein|nr:hypothetical protein [Solirubrobacteraceae bacterium]
MTPWAGVRQRWRKYKRSREAKKYALGPLREFVYLDEVSVYSLIASRKGPIATDYRDTTATLLRSEMEGTVGANAGIAQSKVASRIASSQTSESHTVRKAVIQSTFGELYEAERSKLTLRPRDVVHAPRPPTDLDGLRALISARVEGDPWVIAPAELARGQLIEVEVELQAHEVFQFGTAVSSILDILEGNRELLSGIDTRSLRQLVDGNRILQRLLVGLVPLKGRLVRHRSVIVDGQEWLIHDHLVASLDDEQLGSRPAFVVGVAEQQLFWKDIRRVLFSRSQFLVLGRLTREGLNDQWSPVKLVDVLSTMPAVGESVAQAIHVLPTLMQADPEGAPSLLPGAAPLPLALAQFGSVLAERYGHSYPAEDVASSGVISEEPLHDASTEARNEAFRAVRDHVASKFSIGVDPIVAADLRREVLQRTGLWPMQTGATPVVASPPPGASSEEPSEMTERYIDAEFVAIYW